MSAWNDEPSPEIDQKVNLALVGLVTAMEANLAADAKAIYDDLTDDEKVWLMLNTMGWLAGALHEIEDRGGPSLEAFMQRFAHHTIEGTLDDE